MNDHQLLCFLTVQRILNFTAAAKELYCTQPALSYQIRSLEKELDLTLFERSTTRVVLTAAGRAFVPHAEQLYRGILNARTALKGFSAGHTLTLRLPPVLLQHDPIYPVLMERLHTVLPGHEFRVDTAPPRMNAHLMLCTEADAAVVLPFGSAQPEVERTPIMHNTFIWRSRRNIRFTPARACSWQTLQDSGCTTSRCIRRLWTMQASSPECRFPPWNGAAWKTTPMSTPSCWPGAGCFCSPCDTLPTRQRGTGRYGCPCRTPFC